MVTTMAWIKRLHTTVLFPLMNDQRDTSLWG